MLPFGEASLKPNKKMKTYITPNTECIDMRLMGAILLESGEGSKTNPEEVDPSKPLAPGRVF